MLDICGSNGRSCSYRIHLVNTAARRIHFETEIAVSRTRVQAQAAMNALVQIFLRRAFAPIRTDFQEFRACHKDATGLTV